LRILGISPKLGSPGRSAHKESFMTDLMEILGTLLEFFAFVLLATAVVCVPAAIFLWSSEFAHHVRFGRRSRRRSSIPLTKIA